MRIIFELTSIKRISKVIILLVTTLNEKCCNMSKNVMWRFLIKLWQYLGKKTCQNHATEILKLDNYRHNNYQPQQLVL